MPTIPGVKPLSGSDRDRVLGTIIANHVSGTSGLAGYLFDQISRCLPGYARTKCAAPEAISAIMREHGTVLVLLDQHPANGTSARKLSEHLGFPEADAFEIPVCHLAFVLSHDDCDMYVTSLAGHLLVVGCHEDRVLASGREVWCVVSEQDGRTP